MRLQPLLGVLVMAPIAALAVGCAVVFGISSGEYDPDPFDRDAGGGGKPPEDGGKPPEDGGKPPENDAEPPPCTALLDDLEDGDGTILQCQGRSGGWYTYNDGSRGGTQTPEPGRAFVPVSPGQGTSQHAAHVAGNGFTSRGAGMGFDLNFTPGGEKSTYDASAYSGLSFWAKAQPGTATHIYINFPDRDTEIEGGVCQGTGCGDHYGKGIDITNEWAQYTVKFEVLDTDGIGMPVPAGFDAAHVFSVEFHTARTANAFDFVVDDIAFGP